ncbi:COBW domain-containing protein C15D4,05 OS=Schizosaccharomyces pombe (strain 972 / ATCC 24843) GN=SPBC15D4.05 PE=3 SV=1 [Rhizoctonia solani AG-1 IB]|uniref:COBW domain-containing protein C15D4,05 n=1 Tax=Thanatephorus cucumeris (strain AG1-IB / isolate 7/3/14) TaxID=1108050 RepID=A0A0B7FG18_THACB|nr:COBW domain-containing protein C15D4,05 OS=Schizosaccharomyces pombe (strain 972 / ATCC 24843) GN=SPBC15D4.05 PE=3 SV=1 [Rhizoctonia solani AG-1 IB]
MGVKTAIPVTVFTGFLGAGKTTIILSLLEQLPKDYQAVLLKNEFGDVEVDSQLASNSSLAAVSEILNGCMCCILVGQMKTALLEIRDKYRPDRIIIESSGSAFPATLAFQIRELERETEGDFKLDAIITVVDAENFTGYEDTSPTAKMQAQYTDVILLNKWEHVSERDLDIVLDHLGTLNDLTPKLRCQGKSGVPYNLLFGLDSKQFLDLPTHSDENHHDEVETATVCRGVHLPHTHTHTYPYPRSHPFTRRSSTGNRCSFNARPVVRGAGKITQGFDLPGKRIRAVPGRGPHRNLELGIRPIRPCAMYHQR